MADEETPLPEFPGHTAAFGRIIGRGLLSAKGLASSEEKGMVADLMKLRDDELVLVGQVRMNASISLWAEALAAEIARRNIAALNAFKQQSVIASGRLEGLTKWLIAFTIAVVLLTVVLVVRDFGR